MENPESILEFWFGTDADDTKTAAQQAKLWWSKNDATDLAIAARFEADVMTSASGAYDD
jgi:uncharacterized protein (DUF924 family)